VQGGFYRRLYRVMCQVAYTFVVSLLLLALTALGLLSASTGNAGAMCAIMRVKDETVLVNNRLVTEIKCSTILLTSHGL
jgi:hypothetical protein